jgi:mitogen-activated protein kinase kinase
MTPRELPIHDIVKELKRMKEVRHLNIVKCFLVSPTSNVAYGEVTVVMEFCEGGNLESARKAIKDRGAVVEEKVAGRIAEGVSFEYYDPLLV